MTLLLSRWHELLARDQTLVMGIVNVTPDSFSGDGLLLDEPAQSCRNSLSQAESFLRHGAGILDIGGESTRPGASPVPAEIEIARVEPVISAIHHAWPEAILSIDTTNCQVAQVALERGITLINDVSALSRDPLMGAFIVKSGCPVVLMDNRVAMGKAVHNERLGGKHDGCDEVDIVLRVIHELDQRVRFAESIGISRSQLIVDPGIGFGKTVEQDFQLTGELSRLGSLQLPILAGASRKRFIGEILGNEPGSRLAGSLAIAAVAIREGAKIIRAHDVFETVQLAKIVDATRNVRW